MATSLPGGLVDAGGVQAAGPEPRPTHVLERPAALLDPDPHPVGAEVHVVGGSSVSRTQGGLLSQDPEHAPGAGTLAFAEGLPGRHHVRACAGHETPNRPAGSGRHLEGHVPVVAHMGMPGLAPDGSLQAGALQAPVRTERTRSGPTARRGLEVRHPGTGLATRLQALGHGQGQAPVDHTSDQGHQRLVLGGRVDGQRQLRTLPPSQHPAQARGETGFHLPLDPAGRGPVGPVAEPLPPVRASCASRTPGPAEYPGPNADSYCEPGWWSPEPRPGWDQTGQVPADDVCMGIACRRKKQGRLRISF